MRKILIVVAILFALISCHTQEPTAEYINIPDLIDNKLDIKLSDIFQDYSYTILESKKEIYLSRIDKMIVDGNFILLYDHSQKKLMQFNGDGSFVAEFMKRGKGPGEFIDIASIDVNHDRELLIYRNGEYLDIINYNGNIINSLKFNKSPHSASWLTSDIIVLFYPYPYYFMNDGYEIDFIDREGNVLKRALKHHVGKGGDGRAPRIRTGWNSGSMYYWNHFCDTVYTISKSLEVYPRYVFQHDNRNIPVESYSVPGFQPDLQGKYTVESYDEKGDYIFVFLVYDHRAVRGLINSKLNTSGDIIFDYDKWTYKGFFNDVDGGMAIWPGSTQIDGSNIVALDPMDLLETFNHNQNSKLEFDSKKQAELKNSVIDRLTLSSNQVLMKLK